MKHEDLMTCEEIRYWLKELTTTYGWREGCLARYLGAANGWVGRRINGKEWIYKGEQRYWTRAIDRIISGEVVQVQNGKKFQAVACDDPKPLTTRMRMKVNLAAAGRLEWVPPRRPEVKVVLPSFDKVLERAPWKWGYGPDGRHS